LKSGSESLKRGKMKGDEVRAEKDEKKLLSEIEQSILCNLDPMFDPKIFSILEDEKADDKKFRLAQGYLSNEILSRLLEIANSIHYARSASGRLYSFPDVITRLGVQLTKVLIASVARSSLMKGEKGKELFARSLSISVISKILAQEQGFAKKEINKAELAGLFFEIGKLPLQIYEKTAGDLEENYFNTYWPKLSLMFVKRFNLPAFIGETIENFSLIFDEREFHLSGIVFMAWCTVEKIFLRHRKLYLKSPLPDEKEIVTYTYGSEIEGLFQVFGISRYLEIERVLTERQESFLGKKREGE
jgi:hypothetical protein